MGLSRGRSRIVAYPSLSAGNFEALDTWELEVVPGVLDLAKSLAPIPCPGAFHLYPIDP
jgi:hypothetical protein